MDQLFVPIVFVALLLVVAGVHVRQTRAFARSLETDPDLEPTHEAGMACRTRRSPVVSAYGRGGGKNDPSRWDLTASLPAVGERTSLSLSREGMFGALREMFGVQDIRVGDPSFDSGYTIRGSDPDAVRGLLGPEEVKCALEVFFGLGAWSFQIDRPGGRVTATCRRGLGYSLEEVRNATAALQRALEAFERNAQAASRPLPPA